MDLIKRSIANLPPPWTYPTPQPRFDLVGYEQGQPLLKTVGGSPFKGAEWVTNGAVQAGPVFTQIAGNRIEIGGVPRVAPSPQSGVAIDTVDLYFLVDYSSMGFNASSKQNQKIALKDFIQRLATNGRSSVRSLGLTNLRVGLGFFGRDYNHKQAIGSNFEGIGEALTPPTVNEGLSGGGDIYFDPKTVPVYIPGGLPLTTAWIINSQAMYKPLDAIVSAITNTSIGFRSSNLKIIVFVGAFSEIHLRESTTSMVSIKQLLDDRGVKLIFLSDLEFMYMGVPQPGGSTGTLGFLDALIDEISYWHYEAMYLNAPWLRSRFSWTPPTTPSQIANYTEAMVELDRQFYKAIGTCLEQVKLQKKWSLQDFQNEIAKVWTENGLTGSPPL